MAGGRPRKYVSNSCTLCRAAHKGCSGTIPCKRCVNAGKADRCVPAEQRKRGPVPAGEGSGSSAKKRGKEVPSGSLPASSAKSSDCEVPSRTPSPGAAMQDQPRTHIGKSLPLLRTSDAAYDDGSNSYKLNQYTIAEKEREGGNQPGYGAGSSSPRGSVNSDYMGHPPAASGGQMKSHVQVPLNGKRFVRESSESSTRHHGCSNGNANSSAADLRGEGYYGADSRYSTSSYYQGSSPASGYEPNSPYADGRYGFYDKAHSSSGPEVGYRDDVSQPPVHSYGPLGGGYAGSEVSWSPPGGPPRSFEGESRADYRGRPESSSTYRQGTASSQLYEKKFGHYPNSEHHTHARSGNTLYPEQSPLRQSSSFAALKDILGIGSKQESFSEPIFDNGDLSGTEVPYDLYKDKWIFVYRESPTLLSARFVDDMALKSAIHLHTETVFKKLFNYISDYRSKPLEQRDANKPDFFLQFSSVGPPSVDILQRLGTKVYIRDPYDKGPRHYVDTGEPVPEIHAGFLNSELSKATKELFGYGPEDNLDRYMVFDMASEDSWRLIAFSHALMLGTNMVSVESFSKLRTKGGYSLGSRTKVDVNEKTRRIRVRFYPSEHPETDFYRSKFVYA
eukprot:Nk52_evm13s243 gene=Nk52_evmTU13s243